MARGRDNAGTAQLHIALGAVAFDLRGTRGTDAADDGGQCGVGADADHGVHLGDFLNDLLLIALGQTAGDNNLEVGVFLLVLAGHEDVLDGLRLGRLDKAAGVDDDDIGLAGVRHGDMAILDEGMAEYIGIHLIFRAAEGDNGNFHWVVL